MCVVYYTAGIFSKAWLVFDWQITRYILIEIFISLPRVLYESRETLLKQNQGRYTQILTL